MFFFNSKSSNRDPNRMDDETKTQEPAEEPGKSESTAGISDSVGLTPARSRRQSFDGMRRQLTDDELKNPAINKLLLDMLDEAETSRDEYKSYVDAYHAADKRAEVLLEKLNTNRAIDVFFGVGVGLGGTILGLSPFFMGIGIIYGVICPIIGILLIIGSYVGRVVAR